MQLCQPFIDSKNTTLVKKNILAFSLLCSGFLCAHAQSSTTPKLAPYAVNDSIAAKHNPAPAAKAVLAPSAIDPSVSTNTSNGPMPELLPTKKEDSENLPK